MKKYSLLIALTLILNVFNAVNVINAATVSYRPTLDTPGKMAWLLETLQYTDSETWTIYLARHDVGTYSGMIFDNVYVPQSALINSANLTLYRPTNLDYGTNSVMCTIYGYDGDNIATLNQDLLKNGPYTSALQVFNCSSMTGSGYYTIDVTKIVQEVVNRHNWFSGNNLALVILAARQPQGDTQFYYEVAANYGPYGAYRPTLDIRFNEDPGTGETGQQFIEQYKNFTIWQYEGGYIMYDMNSGASHRIMTWAPYNNLITNRTMSNNGVLDSFRNTMVVVNGTIWKLEYVQVDEDIEIWRSRDIGVSWDLIHEIDVTSAKTSGAMYYSNKTQALHVYYEETYQFYAGTYNLTTSTWASDGLIMSAQLQPGLADIFVDPDGNTYFIRCGGYGGSSSYHTYMRVKPRGGAWGTLTKIFDGGTYAFLRPLIHYSPEYNDLIVTFYRTGSGHWVTYHDLGDPLTTWSTPARVTDTSSQTPYYTQWVEGQGIYNGSIYVGTTDADGGADALPLAARFYYPFTGTPADYNNANFTGQDFTGTTPIKWPNGTIGWITCRFTSGAAVYYIKDMWFFNVAQTAVSWGKREIASSAQTPNLFFAYGQRQGFTQPFAYIVTWNNGTVVDPDDYPCLAAARTLAEIKACLDQIVDPSDYPDDPGGGGFTGDEDPYMGRIAFKRYFTMAGLFLVCAPWLLLAYKRDPAIIPILIILNAVGIGLLLGVVQF